MASANVLTVTSANFDEEVLRSGVPVLVDFWASWCGPCKMIAPLVDEIADAKAGQAKVAKVNIESEGELAARFRVNQIPTLLFFKDGEVRDTVVGREGKETLLAKLDSLI
jgi:thioredoxin 1